MTSEVHVWFATLDVVEDVESLLSDEERARAARYRFEDDRRRSIAARGMLRALAGQYLDRDPRALTFDVDPEHGKPALVDGESLGVNASHSGDLVAVAFARGTAVGVDVERVRAMRDAKEIARRFFSPAEVAMVEAARDVDDAFFTIWTAKEAVVKAIGHGLGAALHAFTVPFDARSLQRVAGAEEWSVAQVAPPVEPYRAAVAVRTDAASRELVVRRYKRET